MFIHETGGKTGKTGNRIFPSSSYFFLLIMQKRREKKYFPTPRASERASMHVSGRAVRLNGTGFREGDKKKKKMMQADRPLQARARDFSPDLLRRERGRLPGKTGSR